MTAVLSPRLMGLPSAKQPILEISFSRALMLIPTPNSVTPRDFPPIIFISAVYQNEMKSLSTLLPHAELMTSPELKSHVIQNEILKKQASRKDSTVHLTLLQKPHSS